MPLGMPFNGKTSLYPKLSLICLVVGDVLRFLELCPQAMALAGDMAMRVQKEGGAALVIDYGRDRPYPASLAAIRGHSFVNMLSQPGLADLSAHVDFSAVRSACLIECYRTLMRCYDLIYQSLHYPLSPYLSIYVMAIITPLQHDLKMLLGLWW